MRHCMVQRQTGFILERKITTWCFLRWACTYSRAARSEGTRQCKQDAFFALEQLFHVDFLAGGRRQIPPNRESVAFLRNNTTIFAQVSFEPNLNFGTANTEHIIYTLTKRPHLETHGCHFLWRKSTRKRRRE